jgi:ACT domain-containing protein
MSEYVHRRSLGRALRVRGRDDASSVEIGPGARRDLLRVLTSSSEVRADVIRQFHQRGKDVMAEVLIALEENDAARQAVIEELRSIA